MVLKTLRIPFEAIVARYSMVPVESFYDSDFFPWAESIEASWTLILSEYEAYINEGGRTLAMEQVSRYQRGLTNDGLWRTVWLFGHGAHLSSVEERFPETLKILDEVPGIRTAFFSILEGGKHLRPHRGPIAACCDIILASSCPQRRMLD